MKTTAAEHEILQIVHGDHHDPFAILGAHPVVADGEVAVAIRVFRPEASTVHVISEEFDEALPMDRVHPAGFFEALFPGRTELFLYRLRITTHEGHERETADPYSFWPVLGDLDIHLFNEGNFPDAHEKLGAHVIELGGIRGAFFAVWAPNARRVSVVGDFNSWDGRRHPMRVRGSSGLWELFIPEMKAGDRYKYEVRTSTGDIVLKADPFGFHAELRPRNASIVYEFGEYAWKDEAWMKARRERNGLDRPISIYELHLGSWRRNPDGTWKTYPQLAEELVPYVREMGFTHIELLPVNEHPFDGSWGYQVTGYFAPTSRFGEPHDFMQFVDTCHRNEIGVILDWVPAHFPTDEHGLRNFDGTCLYEHADPRLGMHQDWGTAIFNFGRNEVRTFLISNALFWLDKYHIDGLRVDAVASMLYLDYSRKSGEWIPNRYGGKENLEAIAFLRDMNSIVHARHSDVLTIAEESTASPGVSRPVYLGGLGFSLKWNMGWMHDMLAYFSRDPIHRKFHHSNLTFALMYAFTENFVLVFSHDEVVHMKGSMLRKMPGDVWQKFANLRALYALMWAFPGKKLLYMGAEFGQWEEWNHDRQLDWFLLEHDFHPKLQGCVRDLNRLYRGLPQLHRIDFHHTGFEWIDFADNEQSIISFLRKSGDPADFVLVVGNFTPVPRARYRVGVPRAGEYEVLFNSDAAAYGGSNLGDGHTVVAEKLECQGRPFALSLTLPPLAVLYLRPQRHRE